MEVGETPPEAADFLAKKAEAVERPLPKIEDIDSKLVEMADGVAEISGTWNPVEIYTADPENIKEQQQEFFDSFAKGEQYNPKFAYSYVEGLDLKQQREQLMKLLGEVRKLSVSSEADKRARVALYFKIKDDLATCDLVEGIKTKDESKIAQALATKYRGSDPVLIAAAQKEYDRLTTAEETTIESQAPPLISPEEQAWLKNKKISQEEFKEGLEWVLNQYGLLRTETNKNGYTVVIDDKTTDTDVRSKTANGSVIAIPRERYLPLTADKFLLLLAHEIEGHARQSANGEALFKIGGGRLAIDDQTLYEGLALRLEAQFKKRYYGGEERTPLPFYTLAVAKAESGGSFYDIFQEQLDMRLHAALQIPVNNNLPTEIDQTKYEVAKKEAWRTTYRVMRGHTDTGNKNRFAMAKDLAYFRGFLTDRQLQARGFGPINEAGVFAGGALQLIADYKLEEKDLPYQYQDAAGKYWEQVLYPQINQ